MRDRGKLVQSTTYQFIPGTSCSLREGPWDETIDGSTGRRNHGQTFEAIPASRHLRIERCVVRYRLTVNETLSCMVVAVHLMGLRDDVPA